MKKSFIFVAAIMMMVLALSGCSRKTDQEKCADLLVQASVCVTTDKITNVRDWHATGSENENWIGQANGMIIIATEYYKWNDVNGTWYGFRAENVPSNAPRKIQKWAERHPEGIFWVCTGGGACRYDVEIDGDFVGFKSSDVTEIKTDSDTIWLARDYLVLNFPVK